MEPQQEIILHMKNLSPGLIKIIIRGWRYNNILYNILYYSRNQYTTNKIHSIVLGDIVIGNK